MIVGSQPRIKDDWSPVGRSQKTQDYYVVRPACDDYGAYWARTVDPDGNVRDRISADERTNYLENVAEELAFVQSLSVGSIIDYGCGPGWFLSELPSWSRLGVEVSPHAFSHCIESGIPVVRTLHDVATQVDVVAMLHVIEHLPNPLRVVAQLRRCLKPGGWFICATPDFDSPCAVRFGDNYRMLHDPTHCSLFTRESLHRMLRDMGFWVHEVRYPFPDKYATNETWQRWHDTTKMSPPWPGNWMTFYCKRRQQ